MFQKGRRSVGSRGSLQNGGHSGKKTPTPRRESEALLGLKKDFFSGSSLERMSTEQRRRCVVRTLSHSEVTHLQLIPGRPRVDACSSHFLSVSHTPGPETKKERKTAATTKPLMRSANPTWRISQEALRRDDTILSPVRCRVRSRCCGVTKLKSDRTFSASESVLYATLLLSSNLKK